jgi:tryptophan synthase alpha chain
MGRIEERFGALKRQKRKAFVAYLTAGDPDLETTAGMVSALEASGVDILEIGVPFSDPTADGPAIQAASQRSLGQGATLEKILAMIAILRRKSEIPIVLFGYYNPILSYGPERFAADAKTSGVDGILVVDLPPEEAGELRRYTDPAGLAFITLIAPTTDPGRVGKILRGAAGFVYFISVTGVTGTAAPRIKDIRRALVEIRRTTTLPIVAGFGISTPEQAAAISPLADGIVIGSALVRLIAEKKGNDDITRAASSFAAKIRRAIDSPAPSGRRRSWE